MERVFRSRLFSHGYRDECYDFTIPCNVVDEWSAVSTKSVCILRGVASTVLCLALVGCGGGSEASSKSEGNSTLTIVEIGQDEKEADRKRYSSDTNAADSSHETLSSCLGSIAKRAADDHGNPLVEKESVRDLFDLTIEDEEYKLPCPVSAFLDKGWGFEQGYTFEGVRYDPAFSFDIELWYKNDPNFNVKVTLKNATKDIVEWNGLSVVAIKLRPLDSFVDFSSKIGIGGGSSLDELLSVLGCNNESALLENKVFVEYHVSLFEKPFYDMKSSPYANVIYVWNKEGRAMTELSLELVEPWDANLRKTDEELEKEKKEAEENKDDEQFDGGGNPSDWVGRTVEGTNR